MRTASRYSALAVMSSAPPPMASAARVTGMRSDRRPTAATMPKNATDAMRSVRSGHMPASRRVCASASRNTPIPMPATSAGPTPDGGVEGGGARRGGGGGGGGGGGPRGGGGVARPPHHPSPPPPQRAPGGGEPCG